MEEANIPTELVEAARSGFFDDFHEDGHPTPQIVLQACLSKIPTTAAKQLASRAIQGEFDAQKWESDAWAARQTGEMGDIVDQLGLRDRIQ